MRSQRRRWRPGDIVQVILQSGFRYLQFVGKDNQGVDVLRVIDLYADAPVASAEEAGRRGTLYWIESSCRVLVEDERFSYIGNVPFAEPMPTLRRRQFGGFLIIGPDGQEAFAKSPIDDEVAHLSLETILPARAVAERLESEWRPEFDREDLGALVQRQSLQIRLGGAGKRRETVFYVDFPARINSSKARDELQRRGLVAKSGGRTGTLEIRYRWDDADTLASMDHVEAEIRSICAPFAGKISGRETSA